MPRNGHGKSDDVMVDNAQDVRVYDSEDSDDDDDDDDDFFFLAFAVYTIRTAREMNDVVFSSSCLQP